jgi:hypothetical protein
VVPTPDNCPGEYRRPGLLDPLVADRETEAARYTMDLRRAMELIAENARLAAENTELRTTLHAHGVEGY